MSSIASSHNERTALQNLAAALRQLLVAAVVLSAAGVAAWLYALSRADGEICARVEERLGQLYAGSGLRVQVESARRLEGRGIEVRGVKILEHAGRTPLLEIDELLLTCDTDWQELLTKQLDVRHVEVRRPTLRVTRGADGDWSLRRLLRLENSDARLPTLTIVGGRIEVRDELHAAGKPLLLHDIHVDMKPVAPRLDESVSEPDPLSALQITGSLAGVNFKGGTFAATVNVAEGGWSVRGSLEDVELSAALVATLPSEVAARLAPFAGVQGRVQLQWAAARRDAAAGLTFAVDGELIDTRLDDSRLPAPLTEIQASFHADHERLNIAGLTARCGQATLWLALDAAGYADDSPLRLQVKARQFEINQTLVETLPAGLQTAWSRFAPRGTVNVDATFDFDGQEWRPEFLMQCLDLSFAYHGFPYRLTGGQGFLILHDGVLTTSDFRALANDRVVRFDGEVRQPGESFTGWVEIKSIDPIALDEKLFAALDERQGQILRSLQPRGDFTFISRFSRGDPRESVDRRIEYGLEDCSIRYVGLPYPLEKVRGMLLYTNGQWQFKNLRGQNDSAYVECKGDWTVESNGGGRLTLELVATDVPLEDDLRDALQPQMRRLWSHLRPTGTIDYFTATVRYQTAGRALSVEATALKRRPDHNVEGRTITMRPVWLPYAWDDVAGSIHYRDGKFEVPDLRAVHGRTSLSLSGDGDIAPDGGWSLRVADVLVKRLNFDQELLEAMPGSFGQSLAKLNLTGPVSAQGRVDLSGSGAAGSPLSAHWDLNFDVENGSVNCGVRLDQIRGGVHLVGGLDPRGLVSEGALDVHSVLCRDVQLTQVRGPIRIEPTRIVFGDAWTGQPARRRSPRPVTAQVFGGSVAADAVVSLVDATWFDIQATLTDADMGRMARDLLPQKRDVSGKATATVRLQGAGSGIHTWRGGGKVHLHDADLYQVPVMLALLKLLSIRQPDTRGFTLCDVGFRLEGDRVYFDQIDFKGDAISLKGSGEMGLDRRINLEFYTMVGRDEIRLPLITPALAEASRQLMEIRVDGTLDDPRVEKKAVPVLNDALRQMFPELAARADARAEGREERSPLLPRIPSPREVLQRGGLVPKR